MGSESVAPRPTALPWGIGNREWGIDKAIRPLPPHPYFIKSRESASPFPIPTIPHSRLPIPKGGVTGQGRYPIFPAIHTRLCATCARQ